MSEWYPDKLGAIAQELKGLRNAAHRTDQRGIRPAQVGAGVAVGRYCSFAYSALACFRMGMSGSASFQRVKKSWYAALALAVSPAMA